MTTSRKKIALYGLLALLSLWPAMQIGLAHRFGLSSWKLAGWGMYATPRLGAGFQVLGRQPDEDTLRPIPVPAPAMSIAQRFHERRRWLGRLETPTDLAGALLDADPALAEVAVLIEQPSLSTTTGYIEASRELYRFPRNGTPTADLVPPSSGRR